MPQGQHITVDSVPAEVVGIAARLYQEWWINSALGDLPNPPNFEDANDDDRGNWCAVALLAYKIAREALDTGFGIEV